MAKITGAHLLMRCLKAEGIKRIFTIVGDTILPLCDAAVDEGIPFIDTRHEAAAMAMADAWCRVTGEPAVALVTGGPGFSNAISGLPNIYTSESPVVFIAGCSELPEKGMYSFQEVDQIGMTTPVTKGSWLIHDHRRIADMTAGAFRTALSGRPGPVHLTIPMDVQEKAISEEDLPQYRASEYRHQGRNPGDPRLIDEALDILSRAERPVVIAANAARYSVSSESLETLVEATGIPLFTVEQARGIVSDDHPLCFGYADGAFNHAARNFRDADAVLLLGKRLDHRVRYGRPPFFSAGAKVIQVDPSAEEIGRNRGVSVGVLGDVGAVVEQLNAGTPARKWKDLSQWTKRLTESRKAQLEELEGHATDETPLHPIRVYKEVSKYVDRDSVLVFDGGDYVQWGRTYMKAQQLGHWMRLGPLAHLGFGLPYALAAKLALPDSKVFLFSGDGSLGFYTMEFDTALRHNLPIVAMLGNDATWSIDKNFQLAYYGRAVATDLRRIRYDKVIEAIGGHGEHVEEARELGPAIERAIGAKKPALIDISTRSKQSPLADAMVARRLAARQGG